MKIDNIRSIKKLALIAMFSDDDLMNLFVLKGGNALDLVYEIQGRASMDLDFSVESAFDPAHFPKFEEKIENVLVKTFSSAGYVAFDIKISSVPLTISAEIKDFWGGYKIEFKVIERGKYEALKENIEAVRRDASVIGMHQERTFTIDLSKYEYCDAKKEMEIDGYTVFVYSPQMLLAEKLRAICQQMEDYKNVVKYFHPRARARDFYDIWRIMTVYNIDLMEKENPELLKRIFEAKRVPLRLIENIPTYKEFHRTDFKAVQDTVPATTKLKSYDFYFDYVVQLVITLEPLWKI